MPKRVLFSIATVTLVGVIFVCIYIAAFWGQHSWIASQKAISEDPLTIARAVLREYDIAARVWSVAYHGTLIVSVVCSALSAFILKSDIFFKDKPWKTDVSAALAATAAFVISASEVIGIHDKWQANRGARTELVQMFLLNPDIDKPELRRKLAEIIQRHDQQWVSLPSAGK